MLRTRPHTRPTDIGHCPTHGQTTVARHRSGFSRAGRRRYVLRCLACHDEYNLGISTRSAIVPTCPIMLDAHHHCTRPIGHPADLHLTQDPETNQILAAKAVS